MFGRVDGEEGEQFDMSVWLGAPRFRRRVCLSEGPPDVLFAPCQDPYELDRNLHCVLGSEQEDLCVVARATLVTCGPRQWVGERRLVFVHGLRMCSTPTSLGPHAGSRPVGWEARADADAVVVSSVCGRFAICGLLIVTRRGQRGFARIEHAELRFGSGHCSGDGHANGCNEHAML